MLGTCLGSQLVMKSILLLMDAPGIVIIMILLGPIIITAKNMQTSDTQYNFSHCPMTDCAVCPQAATAELTELAEPEDLENLWIPAPQPTAIHMLSMTSMVWNISVGQIGLAAWPCSLPALVHLLIHRTWEAEKSP